MNDKEVVLQAQSLGKSFFQGSVEVQVLSGLEFSLARGERVAIVGSSGSGKSTFLHLLGGLAPPTTGQVFAVGQRLSDLGVAARGRLRNRHLGFVYQFHHLLPEFSALENVSMPLLVGGVSPMKARERSTDLLKRVGLGERLTHKPGELSGGERQRAAIARALVNRPAVVLADEPTGNLDEQTAIGVEEQMLEMNQSEGTALLIVTHDLALADRMDRKLLLTGGKLQQVE